MGKRKPKPAKFLSPLERDRNGVEVTTQSDDRGPPERWQHSAHLDERSERGAPARRRVLDVAPLDHYRRRQMIDGRQFLAGDRLRQAWSLAGIEQRVTPRYAEPGDKGVTVLVDLKNDGMMRYLVAMRAVGPQLAHVLLHVVCMERLASEWAQLKGTNGRYAEQSGMLALRMGLDALAQHYGIGVDKPTR